MFGLSCAKKYGGIYVPPHQAVIHQFAREMLAGCGKMILGSDSHTRYGALGTMAIGEGGPEIVKQLLCKTYDINMPDVVGVYLTGSPQKGVGPQDVALAIIGAVFANEATKAGKKCLVIDRRDHIAGNIYTKEIERIQVHQYGAHIFHTSDKEVWNYVNQFAEFNRYTNSPIANYKGEIYNMPFNMNTFQKLWGVVTPKEAKEKIEAQKREYAVEHPKNLEEQAINLVGPDVYTKLVKGYTEKQWGRRATELPAFIIKRLPVRFTYDNNYFNDTYQGIPIGGYTQMVEKLLEDIDVMTDTDFFEYRKGHADQFKKVVYTGMIDEYFDYQFGHLQYRTVRFDTERIEEENYQGNAVVNYTQRDVPYTRVIEHKHFAPEEERKNPKDYTIISREYSEEWGPGSEPYYPVNDEKNGALYEKYRELAEKEENVIFGGRLGLYRYYDMDKVIRAALDASEKELG